MPQCQIDDLEWPALALSAGVRRNCAFAPIVAGVSLTSVWNVLGRAVNRNSRFLVILFAFGAVLLGGLAIAAFAMFVIGTPWLAALNPYYAWADWTNEETTVTEITATIDDRGHNATLLSAFFGVDGGLPPVLREFCKIKEFSNSAFEITRLSRSE